MSSSEELLLPWTGRQAGRTDRQCRGDSEESSAQAPETNSIVGVPEEEPGSLLLGLWEECVPQHRPTARLSEPV